MPPPSPLFPACARGIPDVYMPTFHALCFLPFAALYVVRAQRDDDPILHLYSTVRDSLQSRGRRTCRALILPNRRDRFGCGGPGITYSATRKRVKRCECAKRERAGAYFCLLFFFGFCLMGVSAECVNLVAHVLISCNTSVAPFCINFAPSIYSRFALANGMADEATLRALSNFHTAGTD